MICNTHCRRNTCDYLAQDCLLTPVQIVRYRPDLITDGTVIELERPPAKSEKYQRYIANRGEHRKEYWRERYKGQTEKKWAKYLTVE